MNFRGVVVVVYPCMADGSRFAIMQMVLSVVAGRVMGRTSNTRLTLYTSARAERSQTMHFCVTFPVPR